MAISKDTTTGKWIVPFSTTDTELNSANKYIDANIVVKAPAVLSPSTTYYQTTATSYGQVGPGYLNNTYYIKAATLGSASSSLTVSGGAVDYQHTEHGFTESSTATSYYVDLSFSKTDGGASASYSRSVSTAGWIPTGSIASYSDSKTVTVTKPTDKKIYLPAATVTANASVTSAPSVAVSGAATGFTASSSATSYYVTVSGSPTNGTASGGYSVGNAAGMVAASASGSTSATITPSVTGSGTKIYIPAGSYSAITYGEGGNIGSLTYIYNSSNENYTVSGSADFTYYAEAAVSAGYIPTGHYESDTQTHTTSVSTTLAKTSVTTTVSGTLKVTPQIGNVTKPSGDTWTDGHDGSGSTTIKPTSGVYVAVQSAAAANTATATISSVTAGYSDGTNYGKTQGTASVGANASAVTYLKVKSGSAAVTSSQSITVTQGTLTISGTTVTIPVSGSKSITGTVSTAGWITSVSSATVSASGNVTLTLYNGETV